MKRLVATFGVSLLVLTAACNKEGREAYLEAGCDECHGLDLKGTRTGGPPILRHAEELGRGPVAALLRESRQRGGRGRAPARVEVLLRIGDGTAEAGGPGEAQGAGEVRAALVGGISSRPARKPRSGQSDGSRSHQISGSPGSGVASPGLPASRVPRERPPPHLARRARTASVSRGS